MKLAVIIPMYNEAATITGTLVRLLDQTDHDFSVVLCDNVSTDTTADVVTQFIADHELTHWTVVTETQKGTGAAADTAARTAIAGGATHLLRTDADCLPDREWVARIRHVFMTTDYQMIAGLTHPRTDDMNISAGRLFSLKIVNEIAIAFGKFRPSNKGSQYVGPYMMTSGNNVAITADLYQTVGGFTRTAIEEKHEDRELIQAVRQVTDRYCFRRDILVYASARRVQAWGVRRSLLWYAGHLYKPDHVDIR